MADMDIIFILARCNDESRYRYVAELVDDLVKELMKGEE